MYKIVYTKQAVKDIKNLKSSGLDKKAKELIDIIQKNSFENPPKFEMLVGNLHGLFSRRINIQHRLIYQVYNNGFTENGIEYSGTVKIIRMWTYYDN